MKQKETVTYLLQQGYVRCCNSSQTAASAGVHVFKYISFWGPFSFKPPHLSKPTPPLKVWIQRLISYLSLPVSFTNSLETEIILCTETPHIAHLCLTEPCSPQILICSLSIHLNLHIANEGVFPWLPFVSLTESPSLV